LMTRRVPAERNLARPPRHAGGQCFSEEILCRRNASIEYPQNSPRSSPLTYLRRGASIASDGRCLNWRRERNQPALVGYCFTMAFSNYRIFVPSRTSRIRRSLPPMVRNVACRNYLGPTA
jgi:hypothetical protein